MSTEIRVGQVWRDKDKRRPKQGEIVSFDEDFVVVQVHGNEGSSQYKRARFEQRWKMVHEDYVADEPKADLPEIATTREEWLRTAVAQLREDIFEPLDFTVPEVRVSVGWPGGRGPKANTIGQCWPGESASDSIGQIFISPVLAEPVKVLETLVHEMVHAINHANGETGHRAPFKNIAEPVGLEGKMTSTHAGEELATKLEEIGDQLGKYPHAAINLADKPKVQKTYMLKFVSPQEPDFFVRMTASKLEEYGAPRDPWGNEMEQEL